MKNTVKVEIFVEIEYGCSEHKEMILKRLSKKEGIFGLMGTSDSKSGKMHRYSVTPTDKVNVIIIDEKPK